MTAKERAQARRDKLRAQLEAQLNPKPRQVNRTRSRRVTVLLNDREFERLTKQQPHFSISSALRVAMGLKP